MSPAGRPPLTGETKEGRVVIRVTESERAILDQAAALGGKPTSTWARDTLLQLAAFQIAQQKSAKSAKKSAKK